MAQISAGSTTEKLSRPQVNRSGLPQSRNNMWKIFSRSRKSQGFLRMAREIYKGLEKSGNLKINGYGRQSSETLFILFKRGKDVHSHEIV